MEIVSIVLALAFIYVISRLFAWGTPTAIPSGGEKHMIASATQTRGAATPSVRDKIASRTPTRATTPSGEDTGTPTATFCGKDVLSPLKDFQKRTPAPPLPAGSTDSTKERSFLATPLQDIHIRDVPGVGLATEDALKKHSYINITTAEQLFGFFLYQGRDSDAFTNWLKKHCAVTGSVASVLYTSCLQKAQQLCILGAGAGGDRVARGRSTGCTGATTNAFNNTPLQDLMINQVPGVGEKTVPLLKSTMNITTAEQLFGFFLYLKRDETRFTTWLKNKCDVQGSVAARIYDALDGAAKNICMHA